MGMRSFGAGAAALAVCFVAAPVVANATTLLDGSFEARGAGVSDYCYEGFAAGGNPACSNPSAWSGAGVIRSGSGPWGGTTTPDGSYYSMLQGGQVLSQTFLATSNSFLTFNWLEANRNNYGGLHSYTVSIFDGATDTVLGAYTSAYGGFVGKSSSAFLATGGSNYTLKFNGIAYGDTTTFLDSVSVSAAAVPEPATWALMIGGFGLAGAMLRRRRQQALAA